MIYKCLKYIHYYLLITLLIFSTLHSQGKEVSHICFLTIVRQILKVFVITCLISVTASFWTVWKMYKQKLDMHSKCHAYLHSKSQTKPHKQPKWYNSDIHHHLNCICTLSRKSSTRPIRYNLSKLQASEILLQDKMTAAESIKRAPSFWCELLYQPLLNL